MTRQEIMDYLYTDRDFIYNGFISSVCPFSDTDISLAYNGQSWDFDNIEDAVDAKVFDGKSIIDIWDEIYPQISYQGTRS